MLVSAAIIVVLLLVNAFFVVAEFAIVGVPRSAIDARASRNDRMAKLVQGVLDDPKRKDLYIATAQIGITLASLGLGMYGEHVVADWILEAIGEFTWAQWLAAHGFASVLAVSILTYFHIVIGEMLPKSVALQSAERIALWLTPPMLWIQTLLYPFVITLNGIANAVLRPFGIHHEASSADQYYTSEELQLIVEESEEKGELRAESSKVLQELFEFGELTAGEVMVPRVRITGIPVGAGPEDLRQALGTTPRTRYPVYEGDLDHIIGTYHIKDLLRLLLNGQPVTAAGARPAPVVPETALLDSVLATMRRERAQFAVVIDEHGGTPGVGPLDDPFEEGEELDEIDDRVALGPAEVGVRNLPGLIGDVQQERRDRVGDRRAGRAKHVVAAYVGARHLERAGEVRYVSGSDLQEEDGLVLWQMMGLAGLAHLFLVDFPVSLA